MSCQKCQSDRVLHVTAKCSDMFNWSLGGKEGDGYVPNDIGIGGGDYIGFYYCMDCGQIQGRWPLAKSQEVEGSHEYDPDEDGPAFCKNCKTTQNLEYAPDPYLHEIHNDPKPYHMCRRCRRNAADDI